MGNVCLLDEPQDQLPSGKSRREWWRYYSLCSCTLVWFHLAGSHFPETQEGTPELPWLQARGDSAGLFSFQSFLWATEQEVLSEHSRPLSCIPPGALSLPLCCSSPGSLSALHQLSPPSSARPEVSLITDSRPHLCAGLSGCQAHNSNLQLVRLTLSETTPAVSRGTFKTVVQNCFINSWIFNSEFSETSQQILFEI